MRTACWKLEKVGTGSVDGRRGHRQNLPRYDVDLTPTTSSSALDSYNTIRFSSRATQVPVRRAPASFAIRGGYTNDGQIASLQV